MSETKVIELKYPIEVTTPTGGKVTVSSVTLRRIKAKDLKHLPENKSNVAGMLPLIASVTGLELDAVGEIDMDDLNEIGQALMSFSAGYQGSGDKSSGVSPQPITSLPT